MKISPQRSSAGILANFSLTMLKALLVLAFLGMMMMTLEIIKIKQTEGIKPPVFLMITMSWPTEIDADIDLHMRCPDSSFVNYIIRETCWASLERDSRGSVSDTAVLHGQRITNLSNREVIIMRTPYPGEWIVNVNWYGGNYPGSIPVKIEITSIEPSVKTVWETEVMLRHMKHEEHVVRFKVDGDKSVHSFDASRPVKFLSTSINSGTLR